MYFTPFTIRVGAEQKGFESGAARPVIAMRLTGDGETELLVATDDGGLSWVDRDFVTVVDVGSPASREPRSAPALVIAPEPSPAREPAHVPEPKSVRRSRSTRKRRS